MSKIWEAIFLKKKAPAATCPEVEGFQKHGGHFSEKKRLRQRSQPLRASKSLGPFFKNSLSRNRLNRLLIYPIMVTKKSIWSKSHSGYCFRLPLAWFFFEPAISGHSGQVRSALCFSELPIFCNSFVVGWVTVLQTIWSIKHLTCRWLLESKYASLAAIHLAGNVCILSVCCETLAHQGK